MTFTKKERNQLRVKYNKKVKKDHHVSLLGQQGFDLWWNHHRQIGNDKGAHYEGAPCFTYAEIPAYLTKSGHAEILELA